MYRNTLKLPIMVMVLVILNNLECPGTGLENLGSTCYMNAVLQAFFACKPLTDIVNSTEGAQLEAHNNFLKSYKELLNAHQAEQSGYISPLGFFECSMIGQVGAQQDAEEYANNFMDKITTFPKAFKELGSKVADLFKFEIRRTFVNNNGSVTNEVISENLYKIYFPEQKAYTLKELVDKHYEESRSEFIKQQFTAFISAPKVFILCLARFAFNKTSGQPFKITNPVMYNLEDFEIGSESGRNKYKLFACVLHAGGFGAGHYTAVVRYGQQWYFCNDTSVSAVSVDQVKMIINGEKFKLYNSAAAALVEEQYQSYLYFFERASGPQSASPAVETQSKFNQLFSEFIQTINSLYMSTKLI